MSKPTIQAGNITMSGGGLYSLATIGAKDVIDRSIPRVLEALDSLKQQRDSHSAPWTFSDMGCADGGTSLGLWQAVIDSLRKDDTSDIQIVYADQANNDFNALVKILHGHTQFESYLGKSEDVHVLESGSSFYSPILATNTLHLGFSATAMHWLSQKPCDISNHVHMVGAENREQETFAAQAAHDWQTILLHRAREMVTGGKLVLINFCKDQQGRYLGNTGGINMFDQFNSNWQSMVADGVISQQEYTAMTLPQYYNTVEEFSAPLLDKKSDVYKAGLRLASIETAVVPCPFAEDYAKHGSAEKFAQAYIPTIRSWNESTFMAGLSSERNTAERSEIIESYYSMYQQQVAADPQQHGMGYVHAYMTIEKV